MDVLILRLIQILIIDYFSNKVKNIVCISTFVASFKNIET